MLHGVQGRKRENERKGQSKKEGEKKICMHRWSERETEIERERERDVCV